MGILEKLKLLFKELLGKDLTDEQAKKLEETIKADNNGASPSASNNGASPNATQGSSPLLQANASNNDDLKLIIKLFEEQKGEIAKERAAREDLIKKIEDEKKLQIKQKTEAAIAEAIKNKKIAPKDEEEKKKWEKRLMENFDDALELLGKLPALALKEEPPQGQSQEQSQNDNKNQTTSRVDLMKNVANVFKQNKE